MLNLASIKTLHKNVTSAGTPEALGSYPVPDGVTVVVRAKAGNAGSIYIGGNSDGALAANSSYFELSGGQSVTLAVQNLSGVWLDAANSGDGVQVIFES